MNIDDIVQLFEKLSEFSGVVINVFVVGNVGNVTQSDNNNSSINIFSNCFDNSPCSDVEISS